jgi:threonine dehydrogenase-like Zn-dependent dehydrogenase
VGKVFIYEPLVRRPCKRRIDLGVERRRKAMKAALFYGGADIRVEELPTPEPGPGEVLINVRSAGICGSDLHRYRGANPWRTETEAPAQGRQNGHELAGDVAAIGSGVSGLSIGQRVGIEPEHLIGCGRCSYCRRGDTHLCPARGLRHGEHHSSHGFSQYDVCLARNVHPLPDNVSTDAAAILDCYACAVHAMHRARILPYMNVVILGTGAIGMTSLLYTSPSPRDRSLSRMPSSA